MPAAHRDNRAPYRGWKGRSSHPASRKEEAFRRDTADRGRNMDAIVEPFLGGASCNFGLLRRAGEVPKRNQPLLGYASICAYADIIETSPPRGALMAFAENLSPYGARTTSRKTSLPRSFTSPAKP